MRFLLPVGRHLALTPVLAAALLGASAAPTFAQPSDTVPRDAGRVRTRLNENWKFHLEGPQALLASAQNVDSWQWKAEADGDSAAPLSAPSLDTAAGGWSRQDAPGDTFGGRKGFSWYRATLPNLDLSERDALERRGRALRFEGVDDNAEVYLNGRLLLKHSGWDQPFEVPLQAAWNEAGPNILLVRVQNTEGAGGITSPVTIGLASEPGAAAPWAQPIFRDASWRTVRLPHDYVIEGRFEQAAEASRGALPRPRAQYRKSFSLPASARGKSVWLDFGGVFRDCVIYLNGVAVGSHLSGYAPFRVDISNSKSARFGGQNTLAVAVNPSAGEGWWYEGGGIYRDVNLTIASALHVAPWGVGVTASLPEPSASATTAPVATLQVKTELANDGASNNCIIETRVLDASGKVVAQATIPAQVLAAASREFTQSLTLRNARLWNLDAPYLYRVETRLRRGAQVLDGQSSVLGVRTIRFDAATGFYLNGRAVKIQGTCNHQDMAGVGVAVPASINEWRIKRLMSMGCNAYRTSHNCPTDSVLDACDKLGMLVMDETRHLGDATGAKTSEGAPSSDLSDLEAQVKRDRNHPSVIMWSMANEEPLQSTADGARIFGDMAARVKKFDASRPITSAKNGGWGQGWSDIQDLEGFNYSIGAYDSFHARFPSKPAFGSETASAVATRGEYENDRARAYVSNADQAGGGWANRTQDAWKAIATRPWMAGAFVWTGFDYKGEPTPYSWPNVNSHFGVLDMCGFPKDAYFYYRAWWGSSPSIHAFPHWNWAGKEGQPITVTAYGNTPRAELLLNGVSLGVKEMPRYEHAEWAVPYAPGTLEVRGIDEAGRVTAREVTATTGAPASIRLSADRTALKADGDDATPITVEILDSAGRVVPTASDEVSFGIAGAGQIIGVGNGDPSSHEPDKASQRRAFHGLCMAIVQAGVAPGRITLRATAPGLRAASIEIKASR